MSAVAGGPSSLLYLENSPLHPARCLPLPLPAPADISGSQFGPLGTPVNNATYSRPNSNATFTALGCSVTVEHSQISCASAVGAGAGLVWTVTVDGQASVVPSTNYGRPAIVSFSGAGAANATTDGGDAVVLWGSNFAVPPFLTSVTYGPTGVEYDVTASCVYASPHLSLSCVTAPGVGPVLQWLVTVGGQTNDPSVTPTTSYEAPVITSLSPAHGPTPAGTAVRLFGTGFAPLATAAAKAVLVDAVGAAGAPTAVDLAYYVTAVQAGGTGSAAVAAYIAALVPATVLRVVRLGPRSHAIDVLMPAGYGPGRRVFAQIGGGEMVSFHSLPRKIS